MPIFKTHKQPTKRTSNGKDAIIYEYKNFRGTLPEIIEKFPMNKSESAIRWRLKHGDDIVKAIEEPAYTFQKVHGKKWGRHLEEARRKAAGEKKKPVETKPQKPRHHQEIVDRYMGRCLACGALLLKQSLENNVCQGGC